MFTKFKFTNCLLILPLLFTYLFLLPPYSKAAFSPGALTVQINQIDEEKEVTFNDLGQMQTPPPECRATPNTCHLQTYQKMTGTLLKGEKQGEKLTIISGDSPSTLQTKYQLGDQLLVEANLSSPEEQSHVTYHVSDYWRQNQIILLFIIFLVIAAIVTKVKGLKAIIGMAYSFFIILKVTLPLIIAGHNPIIVSILTIILVLPPTFYFSHGFNRKTHAGLIGTSIAMILTVILAYLAIAGTKLNGYGSEETSFITALMGNTINIQALLLAGIMIAALGTLNDVTISQASVVAELKKSNPQLKFKELYQKSMSVGQDHIVSMIDTLILVYAGGSLPLLILLSDSSRPLLEVVNYELVAEEIVTMLVGSIGLILAVPITTFITCFFYEET